MTRAVGVLALQGGVASHLAALADVGRRTALVRSARDLDDVDGLVLPGGESTVQLRLIERAGLAPSLCAFAASGRPILATCAGLILAAARVTDPEQPGFALVDVAVARNGWGRQVDSFEARSDDGEHPLVFIRAPRIVAAGEGVRVLARFRGEPVLVQSGNFIGATFHPELGPDRRVHRALFGAPAETPHVDAAGSYLNGHTDIVAGASSGGRSSSAR